MRLLKSPDSYIIDHSGLDVYFFLRYLRMMMVIFLVGCAMTFPILLPINGTGGGGQTGLDFLSFSNISGNKNRYYAHVFVGWLLLGFVLWYFTRELLNFKRTRQEYLRRPEVSSQISQRTILLTAIPKDILTVEKLAELFGSSVEKVWINRNHEELQNLVDERDECAILLENAETQFIKAANKIAVEGGKKEVPGNYRGNVSTLYIEDNKRPRHTLGLPVIKFLLGKRVDSINWARARLANLNPEIVEKQKDEESRKELSSAFITFTSLAAAHRAAQLKLPCPNYIPFRLNRTLAPNPSEIIWSNLRISYPERMARVTASTGFVALMIVFWAAPVAVVGCISNINYLTNRVQFLRFILSLPPAILGVITGLLPSVMLAMLMALLPVVLRCVFLPCPADISDGEVERRAYLLESGTGRSKYLLLLSTFLVTALASSATTVVAQVIDYPGSVTTLLAANLPKSSNFYISYLLLQGFSTAGGGLLQIVGLILFYLLSKLSDNTPRKLWTRWNTLNSLGWGTVFPIYTNLAAIAITYSLISPLILIFAAGTFGLLYFAYLYNFLYVYDQSNDTGGMIFPRAIWQSFAGVYILEVFMTGLFGIATAYTQMALFVITIPITVIYQIILQWKIGRNLEFLDRVGEDDEKRIERIFKLVNRVRPQMLGSQHGKSPDRVSDTFRQRIGLGLVSSGGSKADFEQSAGSQTVDTVEDNAFNHMQGQEKYLGGGHFLHPAITTPVPVIWIPKDLLRISKEEIRDTEAAGDIAITDRGARLDDKNKLVWEENPPDHKACATIMN